jgi:hypothetical protein
VTEFTYVGYRGDDTADNGIAFFSYLLASVEMRLALILPREEIIGMKLGDTWTMTKSKAGKLEVMRRDN